MQRVQFCYCFYSIGNMIYTILYYNNDKICVRAIDTAGLQVNAALRIEEFVVVITVVVLIDGNNRFDGKDFVSDLQSGNKIMVFINICVTVFCIYFFHDKNRIANNVRNGANAFKVSCTFSNARENSPTMRSN